MYSVFVDLNMKSIFTVTLINGIYMCYLTWYSTGQSFEYPSVTFKKFKMDMVNKGTFNVTDCLNELLNCWEIIKPDVICSEDHFYESVCGLMRQYCHDFYGNYDSYLTWFKFSLFESVCYSSWHEQYT